MASDRTWGGLDDKSSGRRRTGFDPSFTELQRLVQEGNEVNPSDTSGSSELGGTAVAKPLPPRDSRISRDEMPSPDVLRQQAQTQRTAINGPGHVGRTDGSTGVSDAGGVGL